VATLRLSDTCDLDPIGTRPLSAFESRDADLNVSGAEENRRFSSLGSRTASLPPAKLITWHKCGTSEPGLHQNPKNSSTGPDDGQFDKTRWSRVLGTGGLVPRKLWLSYVGSIGDPLYAFARRRRRLGPQLSNLPVPQNPKTVRGRSRNRPRPELGPVRTLMSAGDF
jgi:hypothetical protein